MKKVLTKKTPALSISAALKKKRTAGTPQAPHRDVPKLIRALKTKNENLERALDVSSLVSVTDAQGTIIYANAKFCAVSEYPSKELLGQNHRIINSGYHSKEFMKNLWQTIMQGDVWKGDIRNRKKSGGYYWVQSTIIPFLDKTGKPYQFYAIRQDITERKLNEEKLMHAQEALLQAQQLARLGTWEWNIINGKSTWSPEVYRIYGLSPDKGELSIQEFQNYISPDAWQTLNATVSKAIETGAAFSAEYEAIRADKSSAWVIVSGVPIRDETGKITTLRGSIQDISERRKSEMRIREQAMLLNKARDAIIVRSLVHQIQSWNNGAEKIYGWSAKEAVGRSIRDLLYSEPGNFDSATAQVIETGEFNGEVEQVTRSGQSIIVLARWTLLSDETGKPEAILAINTDITERKKLEQQFLRAQRLESIGTLAGGIAHDLNNMLTPITLAIEVLKLGEINEEQRELLDTIAVSARRGAAMVKQVLSFARGVEGDSAPMQLAGLIADIEQIIHDTFPKNLQLSVSVPNDLWLIKGDETQLHQVLLNIVVNARDAMPDGGTLTLSAENCALDAQYAGMNRDVIPGNYVSIKIEDSGEGMAPEILEKIFEPFFTTKEQGRGTGLGLSTSIGIIKTHNGFIRAYSEPNKGTRFQIFLPALLATEVPETAEKLLSMPRGNGELILVVDDEAPVRNVIRQTLEAFGYAVKTAGDGAEAIAIFAEQKDQIALVLTDMMMPVLDGLGTIQVIRRLNPRIPIIAASGVSANGKTARLVNEDVKYFLAKPYTADVLLKMIQQALSEGQHK